MRIIKKVCTSLEQVYDRLGDVNCTLTITDDDIIVIEAINTTRREKRIEGLFKEETE